MKLKIIANTRGCVGGDCPTIYQSDNGRIFVQGKVVDAIELDSFEFPSDEQVVEIGPELLEQIALRATNK